MGRASRRTLILSITLTTIAACGILLGAVFAALQSPWLLTRLAGILGYDVHAQAVSFSPSLSGSISGLSITGLRGDRVNLLAAAVRVENSLDKVLRGEIERLELQAPTVTLRLGGDTGGTLDLSFLKTVPRIRLLNIRNATVLVSIEGRGEQVRFSSANLTVRDYSSVSGGSIRFETRFDITQSGGAALAASGRISGDFQLAGVYPRPYGKGTLVVAVDSGRYTAGSQTVALSGLTLTVDMAYDKRSETFAITALRGESKNFGTLTGTARAVLQGVMPWNATLSATAIDFAQVFAVITPLLPEAYRSWTIGGRGAVDATLQGTYADAQLSLDGSVAFSLSGGGFSSPDGTKAAEGLNGTVVLKLQYAAPDQKLTFNLQSEGRDGEFLWGGYYTNLAGRTSSLSAAGGLSGGGERRFFLNGLFDLFQTGDYSFSAEGSGNGWAIRLKAADVSHGRLLQTILSGYLSAFPALANLSVTGTSSLDTVIRRADATTTITGTYRTAGTALNAPQMPLTIQEIAADVPFDLAYPAPVERASPTIPPGFLRLRALQRQRLTIDRLEIPLRVEQNRLEMVGPVSVPFFAGTIRLYGVQIDDLLFPARYRFGIQVEGVDLGLLTQQLLGTQYPGSVSADLGLMRYEKNRLTSEGQAIIGVFGGEVEAAHVFAENLLSPSRRYGGDITFRNIHLEEVTRKIAIGRMSGVVQGKLSSFVMEYGQPASFALEIRSVEVPGVDQWISLEAIQSISILGTGARSALNRGITAFFKQYPYSRIGIRCVLDNDRFTVRGTIQDGGKEYLVRRGFLRGVDVVNQNPENVISFKDMQERIDRIWTSRPAVDDIQVE